MTPPIDILFMSDGIVFGSILEAAYPASLACSLDARALPHECDRSKVERDRGERAIAMERTLLQGFSFRT